MAFSYCARVSGGGTVGALGSSDTTLGCDGKSSPGGVFNGKPSIRNSMCRKKSDSFSYPSPLAMRRRYRNPTLGTLSCSILDR